MTDFSFYKNLAPCDTNITAGGDVLIQDEYWNKFVNDGKVESYLNYREHLKTQGSVYDGTNSIYDRRTDNSGATNR